MRTWIGVLLLAAVLLATQAAAGDRLPGLGVAAGQTSVSGLSSGAYMAGQFQLAFSSIVVGAGIVAGGPWGCAQSSWGMARLPFLGRSANLAQALNRCMATRLGGPDGAALARAAGVAAARGRIDPLANLRDDRVYLFHGEADAVVGRPVVEAAESFYLAVGVPAANLRTVYRLEAGQEAGHGFLVKSGGSACDAGVAPFLAGCGYDQAGEILAWIYPDFDRRPRAPEGRLLVFDQTEFLSSAKNPGLAAEGVAYVPASCADRPGCRVHIAFHGCLQSRTMPEVGDRFIEDTGYLPLADANRLVILFPQTDAATTPNACWDWWGYTGPDFLSREAPQLSAVRAMLERLAQPAS
jgi:poly(3-hydroxybutyrate) depolymerase